VSLAALDGLLRRICTSPAGFAAGILCVTVAGLGMDHWADVWFQAFLGLCTWIILVVALRYFTPRERAQTVCVVLVASCAEVVGSILWGMYSYRLGNLPPFVPPGHGLVYLTGLRLSQSRLARAHARPFVGLAVALAALWAGLGLSGVLGRIDAAGAFGALVLCIFLVRGRAPTVYAGVFLFVAFLEIYGTAVGTWRWAAEIPGLGVPDGNPPSGAASGYVFFDISALFLAPYLLGVVAWGRARLRPARSGLSPRPAQPGRTTLITPAPQE
jgi:hypothetical protein